MKTFLTLLLLIPSLSWGEVIPLSCERYKSTHYDQKGVGKVIEGSKYKSLVILDNSNKTLLLYGDIILELEKEYEFHYIFRRLGGDILERVFLNKYTHALSIERTRPTTDQKINSSASNCEIVKKIL